MLINYQTIIIFLYLFLMLGCTKTPQVIDDKYTLEECKHELLEATDYEGDKAVDLIVVDKKKRTMYLYKDNKVQKSIPISLGKNPVGTKEQEGDNKTPEGTFWISRKLCSEKYYRSLCISYPLEEDKKKAAQKGVKPGGNITIHAQPTWNANGKADSYTLAHDWTQGCVAVTNETMSQLWYAVHEGIPIIIWEGTNDEVYTETD